MMAKTQDPALFLGHGGLVEISPCVLLLPLVSRSFSEPSPRVKLSQDGTLLALTPMVPRPQKHEDLKGVKMPSTL